MKKSFKIALQGLSIAAMLAFASNGFSWGFSDLKSKVEHAAATVKAGVEHAASTVAADIAQKAPVVERAVSAVETNVKQASSIVKAEAEHLESDAKSLAASDVVHEAEDVVKKLGHSAEESLHNAKNELDTLGHAAKEKAHDAWVKSEKSLTAMAEKVKAAAPKALADIEKLSGATERRLELFRLQAAGKIDEMVDTDKAAFEKQLKAAADDANAAIHQAHELFVETKKNNPKFGEEMMGDAWQALTNGAEHFHHAAKKVKQAGHSAMQHAGKVSKQAIEKARKAMKHAGDKVADEAKHGAKGKGKKV